MNAMKSEIEKETNTLRSDLTELKDETGEELKVALLTHSNPRFLIV